MIKTPTILILGAGTSIDYGFPLGRELLFSIVAGIEDKSKQSLFQHLRRFEFEEDKINAFARALKESPWSSVDVFLMNRREFMRIGKHAIAIELVQCEKWPNIDSRRVRDRTHLYEYIFQEIGSEQHAFQANQLSIITFNYDRSFEEYLYRSLGSGFGLNDEDSTKVSRTVRIHHMYGRLGVPIHQDKENGRHYSPEIKEHEIERLVKNIKIFSESVSSDERGPAIGMIKRAQIICFLGFSYHETNLANLELQHWFTESVFHAGKLPEIHGTAYGLDPSEVQDIKDTFKGNIKLGSKEEKALDFLQNHRILR